MKKTISIQPDDLLALADQTIKQGGIFSFISRGHSMNPHIEDRDKVTISKTNFAETKIGDIVLCKLADGQIVLHRVISKMYDLKSAYLEVIGDNELLQDPTYIPQKAVSKDVIGKVTTITHKSKTRWYFHFKQIVKLSLGMLHHKKQTRVSSIPRFSK